MRITSEHKLESPLNLLTEAMACIQKNQEISNKLEVQLVDEVARGPLKELGTPKEFHKNYTALQRSHILDVQFTKVSADELKPYLLVDKLYMIHHFREKGITDDYYYNFDTQNHCLHLTSEEAGDDHLRQIIEHLDPQVKESIEVLDLREFFRITTLDTLAALDLTKLKKIDCTDMFGLKSIEMLPQNLELEELILESCAEIIDFTPLEGMSIRKLNINNCRKLVDFNFLLKIKDLKEVDIRGCGNSVNDVNVFTLIKQLVAKGVDIKGDRALLYSYHRYYKNHPPS